MEGPCKLHTTKICKILAFLLSLEIHSTHTLRNLYFSFIYTYLKNGIMVWGSAAATHISILEKCQEKVIRIIASSSAHTEPLFRQLNILTVNKMYKLQIAVFMYRVHHQLYPPVILHFFERVNQDRTRQKRILMYQKPLQCHRKIHSYTRTQTL